MCCPFKGKPLIPENRKDQPAKLQESMSVCVCVCVCENSQSYLSEKLVRQGDNLSIQCTVYTHMCVCACVCVCVCVCGCVCVGCVYKTI